MAYILIDIISVTKSFVFTRENSIFYMFFIRKKLMLKNNIITVDCDEVLSDTVGYILKHTNFFKENKYEYINLNMLTQMYYYIHDNFGKIVCSKKNIYQKMTPILGAVDAIKNLYNRGYDLYVITGRTNNMKDFTYKWLDYHFPNMIKKVYFCNNYQEKVVSKNYFCSYLKSSLMIDDDPRFINDIKNIGVMLMNKPWNKGISGKNIKRVISWENIINIIENVS